MPKYRCHKEVWALKIVGLTVLSDGTVEIIPEKPFAAFTVTPEYAQNHKPEVGGYFVVYKDGYASYSPAKAFEEGYTLV